MKRLFAVLLVLALLLSLAPISALAEDVASVPAVEDVPVIEALSAAASSAEAIETVPAEYNAPTAELQATYSGTCGSNLTWSFNSSTGKLTISGSGEMWNYELAAGSGFTTPWYNYSSSIQSISIGSGVTSVGNMAFSVLLNLSSVSFSDTVASIGDYAFWGDPKLTTINLPSGLTRLGWDPFGKCDSSYFVISASNTSFSSYGGALYNKDKTDIYYCPSQMSGAFSLPNSVASFYTYAFSSCHNMTSISVSSDHPYFTSISGVLFSKDKTILYAFPRGKSGSYIIPDGVREVYNDAFASCSNLTSITIPDSVTNINTRAFELCKSISEVYIGNGVECIGEGTFTSCSALKTVTIGNGVTYIANYAFDGCSSISNVTYSGTSAEWGNILIAYGNTPLQNATRQYRPNSGRCGDNVSWSFNTSTGALSITGSGKMWNYSITWNNGALTTAPWKRYCSELRSVSVGSGVTSIGDHAFHSCTALKNLTLSSGLKSIGGWSLFECTSLESVTIPASVSSLDGSSFAGCKMLTAFFCVSSNTAYAAVDGVLFNKNGTTLVSFPAGKSGPYAIPNGVKTIGFEAFYQCSGLTSVTIPDGVEDIGEYAFCYCGLTKIRIPNSLSNIRYGAFSNCNSLTSAIYCGTEIQWDTITIGDANDQLKTVSLQYHAWDDGVITSAATCTANGVKTFTCTICGETKTEGIPALVHAWDSGKVTSPATCTAAGVTTYICTICGATHTEVGSALGHNLVHHESKAATCEEIGWEAYDTCTRCDYTTYVEIPATGHDLIHHDAQVATHTEVGWEAYDTCSRCDYTTYVEIPVVPYIPGDVSGDDVVNAKDVTILRRFIAGGYGISVIESVADVNNDGVVNAKDVTFLRRFFAGGYGIELT